jgi:hypothetical protein
MAEQDIAEAKTEYDRQRSGLGEPHSGQAMASGFRGGGSCICDSILCAALSLAIEFK